MPPKASQRLTSSRSYDRVEGEGTRAFEAFVHYRNLGPERTLDKVAAHFNKHPKNVQDWSSEWNWVERVAHWDAMLDEKTRERAEAYIPIWESRRQVALERMMLFASKMMSKAEAMLDHPIVKEVFRETNGGQTIYHIVEPAGWNWSGLATVVRVASELQAATIAEGLMESDDEQFDVEAASEDELREYLRKHKRRAQLRRSAT